jgi:nucleoid-associated protein YgaU
MFSKSKVVENLDNFNNDSRYLRKDIFYDNEGESYFMDLPLNIEIKSNFQDSTYKVNVRTENRLDLIAHLFYNNSRLWWVIADANGIDDPSNVPVGTTLNIPSVSSIFGVGGVLE